MPIREKSFRIGAGRYLQEGGILNTLGAEVARLGKYPLVVGGRTALSLTQSTVEESLRASGIPYRIEVHTGTCNDEDAKTLAELALSEGCDVIVGVGGGVLMDFAKMIGCFASLPVLLVPTSSATCAAYTPLSVRYTKEGHTVGSHHHEREVSAVLADTAVIATQPPRLLLSGVFDAMAKFPEIMQRFDLTVRDFPLGLDYAYVLASRTFEELTEKTEVALCDMARGELTDTVEQVIFATVAATGVISGIARGSNQCALAHKFYEITRVLYTAEAHAFLHGEIVGVGLLLQNHYNGEIARNEHLLALMHKYGMPSTLGALGIPSTFESFSAYLDRLKNSSAIAEGDESAVERLTTSLRYLWNLR